MTTILVIEDEQDLREEIADILRFEGYEVLEAEDGQSGVQLAKQQHPELIICDIMMPVMDGFSVLTEIRSQAETALTPFIFLTARAAKSDMRQGMDQGADDYLAKPFTHEELVSAVQARLKRRQTITEMSNAELEHAKTQLTRLVAHELRTPLVSIKMVSEIISRRVGQLPVEQLQELLGSLTAGSKRLSHLVEQMILLTHLDTNYLTEDFVRTQGFFVPMSNILPPAVGLARQFAKRKSDLPINLDMQAGNAVVLCDTASLKHAFAELIGNALAFSPENQHVDVSQWEADSTVWIEIADQGLGIPQDQLTKAMEAFQQVNREKHEQQGMGLGLPLSSRIIEIHRGKLELNSTVGQGTRARIQLPVATEVEARQ
jgi:two-component system sensor histidine kinase/response regulator